MTTRLSESDARRLSEKNKKAWKEPAPVSYLGETRQPNGEWAKPKREKSPIEHVEQCEVIRWWDFSCSAYGLDHRLLVAIPNGSNKSMATAAKFKREGLRAGFPDLFLARRKTKKIEILYFGLFIEMKRADWKEPSSGAKAEHWRKQRGFHQLLEDQGYRVRVCCGAESAIDVIKEYLK